MTVSDAVTDTHEPDTGMPGDGVDAIPARWSQLVAIGCWAAIVVPMEVALVAMRRPHWYPVADLAQYELRVRDVGSMDSPLVGLPGRIGTFFDQGSHPGPLSFWMLAPVYRLLGASSWAFEAAAVSLHALASGLVLWMARRRGGLGLLVGVAAALAIVTRFYGGQLFIEPWNPYLPVLWWVVLLFAVWSVIDDDLAMLPIAVLAGSFSAQTHLPYVGLVGGLAAFLMVAVAAGRWAARRRGEALDPGGRLTRWTLGSALLAVVLWVPPVIDQIWGRGNLSRIRDSLINPTDVLAPVRSGLDELVHNLDLTRLLGRLEVTRAAEGHGSSWSGMAFVACWAIAAIVAFRLRERSLVRLHAVTAAVVALAAFSVTRIYGRLWWYLFLWAWGLALTMAVATVWTVVVVVRRRLPPDRLAHWSRIGLGAALAVLVVASTSSFMANIDTQPARPDLSADLGVVSEQTAVALRTGDGPGRGRGGPYLVRWVDRVTLGSQGFGLVNELERAGFEVGVDERFGVGAATHRILPIDDAVAVVELVTGPDIAEWERRPGARRVGYVDARTPAEVALFDRRMASIDAHLRAAGLADVADDWTGNLFAASLDPRIPGPILDEMVQVLDLPAPVAVFLLDTADAS